MTHRQTKNNIAALVAAMLFALGGAFPSHAQEAEVPSVSIRPSSTTPDDPNGGQWFVMALSPGQTGRLTARISNTAETPQRVKLYLVDLLFNKDGGAVPNDQQQTDVGAWGRFLTPEVTVGARQTIEAPFEVTVPSGADPGDHVGAVVGESEPQTSTGPGGGNVRVVKRVAVRLYVTVPGEATKAFTIESIDPDVNSTLFGGTISTVITLRNTGRVRLHPKVTVNGQPAKGPELLLARSVEKYIFDRKIPWYGGPVGFDVLAQADGGVVERVSKSVFVVPWGLIIAFVAALVFVLLGRIWWKRRMTRLEALRADIRRLESLVVQRPGVPESGLATQQSPEDDEIAAIRAALKRAVRTESQPSVERLALALHETGTDALDEILHALQDAGDERLADLLEAAASYGQTTIAARAARFDLPADTARSLLSIVRPKQPARPRGPKDAPAKARPKAAKPKTAASKPARASRKPVTPHRKRTQKKSD